jgi:Protein of unknown function (DUF3102)
MTTVVIKSGKSRQEHAKLINTAWQKGVESILATGERVSEAKLDLEHGEFLAMVESDLSFGPRTAQRLMAIAGNTVLSNPTHVSHLPPSWGTLAALAKLPTTLLLAKIKEGAIHPGLERKDVKALCPPPEPEQRDDDLPPAEPEPVEDPTHDDETNSLITAWVNASPEARRKFVHARWDEIMRARDQAGPAKSNGNAGADHWAHLSKENTEAVDRWIESDK